MTSLFVGLIALALSVVSVVWQFVTWRGSGPLVRVEVSQSVPVLPGQRPGDLYTQVTARNLGRMPITVTSWALELPDGSGLFFVSPAEWSSPLPFRLDSHAEASWWVRTAEVRQSCAERGIAPSTIGGIVSLANGKTAKAKRKGIGIKGE